MTAKNVPTLSEVAVEYLTQGITAEYDLDRESVRKETRAEVDHVAAKLGLDVNELRFDLDDKSAEKLCAFILDNVEEEEGGKWKGLVEDSREGAAAGSLTDPLTILAVGAALGFVILCSKVGKVDLAKKVVEFGEMPEGLGKVLRALIGLGA